MENNIESFCEKCGEKIEAGKNFCSNCGKKIDNNESLQEEIKAKLSIHKKSLILIGSCVIGAIVLLLGFFMYINSQPKSILGSVNVEFLGYNKSGVAKVTGDYQEEIKNIITQEKGNENLSKYYDDVSVSLDLKEGLSNGDKAILTVKTNKKDNPIKSEEKTFVVKGLPEIPKISNLSEINSSLDAKVRSTFVGNSSYSWKITNEKSYFISGSIDETNTSEKGKEQENSSPLAFSVVRVYKFKGTADRTKKDEGYILAGYSDLTLSNDKVNISSIPEEDEYWHTGDGSGQLTFGFLNWTNIFKNEQEVTDWMKVNYPSASELK